jgi:colanic acid biosynthesis glycosyl transferase WcaI
VHFQLRGGLSCRHGPFRAAARQDNFLLGAPMRILVIGINYSPDFIGVAKYNTELCEALALCGHEVRVVTAPPYYPAWKIPTTYRRWRHRLEKRNGVSIGRVPIYVPTVPSGIKRLVHHASFAMSSALSIFWLVSRWRPNLIFSVAPSLMSAPVASFMASRIGAASWLHIQDLEVDAAFNLGLLRNRRLRSLMIAIERRVLQSFDRVSTISPQMRGRLESKGVEAAKLREIRNWIDLSGIQPGNQRTDLRKELKFDNSNVVGLYSGTMSNKQGIELIIETAQALEESHPHIKFLLCGEGPHKKMLQGLASGLRNIHFIDFQPAERFAELLSTADFHLIPQKAEAADLVLPSKLGAIFASGRPAIVMANLHTGLAEEVEGAGIVIPPGVASELSKAVIKLADNFELRSVLGKNGRARATERWDKETILRSLVSELAGLENHDSSAPYLERTCEHQGPNSDLQGRYARK